MFVCVFGACLTLKVHVLINSIWYILWPSCSSYRYFRANVHTLCAHGPSGFVSSTYSLHCSSVFGLPFRVLYIDLVKPKKGTTMETIGSSCFDLQEYSSGLVFQAS